MRRIVHIILHNLKLLASDRAALLWLLAMPLVFTLVLGFAFSGRGGGESGPVRYALTVANLDEGHLGREFLEAVRSGDTIAILEVEGPDADIEAERLVSDGDRSSALVIPRDYTSKMERGEAVVLSFYRNPDRLNPHVTRQALELAVSKQNAAHMVATGAREAYAELWQEPSQEASERMAVRARAFAREEWETPPITVTVEALGRTDETDLPPMGFGHSSPAMALMFVLLNGLMASAVLVEERRQKTLRRLFTTPVTRAQVIAANFGWRFLVGFGQLWFLIGFGAMVFRVDWGDSPAGLLLVGITYVAAVSGLSVLVGSLSRTSRQAESLSLVLALTMCALGGLWWPLEITPRVYQMAGHAIPTGWAMDAMHNLIGRGYSLTEVAPQALVLAGFAIGFSVLAVLAFRREA